jgi:intracellular septation protein
MSIETRGKTGVAERRELNPWAKMGLEMGPLILFFVVNGQAGIFWATGIFMGAMAVSLGVMFALTRHIPPMPLITALFVGVFGGLTLWLQDETFIKIKPTLVYCLFAGILIAGLMAGRTFLKPLLGTMLALTDAGWRLLTWRWAVFFLALAVLNEIVWRNVPTDTWVTFKVFGFLPLTLIFALAQIPLIRRHEAEGVEHKKS